MKMVSRITTTPKREKTTPPIGEIGCPQTLAGIPVKKFSIGADIMRTPKRTKLILFTIIVIICS
jgi:hypothetical protein